MSMRARNLHDYVPAARRYQPDGEFVRPASACLGRAELSEAGTIGLKILAH